MSQHGGDALGASPPGRPRHQIKRSISEISSPIRLHRHHSHRAGKETDRDARSAAPQSAVVQTQRSLEWSRSEGVTPNLTPNASRRTSVLYASADEAMPAIRAPRGNASLAGLVREQQKAAARESGLQRSLNELDNFATSTTRQLDDTYDSLLERLNAMQNTIIALKELSESSRLLSDNFSTEADELVTDINMQLHTFGQFEDQQRRIESLQKRIEMGRKLIRSLSERVDAVSARVTGWERADKEWQEKTRRRLKVVWVVTSVIFFSLLLLFVGTQYGPESLESTTARIASDGLQTAADVVGAVPQVVARDDEPQGRGGLIKAVSLEGSSNATDILHVFDEL
ncbi:uncharacterized protein C8A04DRAFT_24277 [Dichotomopilus funicola]|uniref:Uncharacterized protein n=1 Tax=Dichotomopilus funicola TaxID=1934379 RepID=A0AAN6ZRU9_9PEZI|nr:hypothetical protein C8A04DRAFT_24277 [Dichotomopilus funicola]